VCSRLQAKSGQQLIRNQQVIGSSPIAGSIRTNGFQQLTIARAERWLAPR
jgi:hypothetical protein